MGARMSRNTTIWCVFLLLIGVVAAQPTSSANYNLAIDISSSGGDLSSSSNYISHTIIGDIAGPTTSTNYKTTLGFLAGSSQVPVVNVSISGIASQVRFKVGIPPSFCIAPTNQTTLIGIYNVTVTNGPALIYGTINETFPCFNVTLSGSNSCDAGKNLTTSPQTLIDALNGQGYVWAFSNSLSCLSIPPKFNITIGGG
jgi:hypothetical protein